MRKTLLKYGKEFAGFKMQDGKIQVNYYEKNKLKTTDINDNYVFNVREIRLLTGHFDKILHLINLIH